MAIRKIITDSNERLRKKSRPVTDFNDRIKRLIQDLKDTLKETGGVGLAAPQVGILRRAFVISNEDDNFALECINPKILEEEGEELMIEACLSCEGKQAYVKRPAKLKVEFYDINGKKHEMELEGLNARIFYHEYDHLDGILFYDKEVVVEEEE